MADGGYAGLTAGQRDVAKYLDSVFSEVGLGTLAPKILEFLRQGYSSDTIELMLQETAEYKKRFAANEKRVKNGLPALPVGEYVKIEQAYKSVAQAAGLAPGFYDRPEDFQAMLERDIAPADFQRRIATGMDAERSMSREAKQFLKTNYGIGPQELIMGALDANVGQQIVEQRYAAARIGGATGASRGASEKAAGQGYTGAELDKMSALAGQEALTGSKLASIHQTGLTVDDVVGSVFGTSQSSSRLRARTVATEASAFSGKSGQGSSSLTSERAGSF